jgi:hypothetical protein
MHRWDLPSRLLQRRRERFSPQPQAVSALLVGQCKAKGEFGSAGSGRAGVSQLDQSVRRWSVWLAAWATQTRASWGLDPAMPAILVLPNVPTSADLLALPSPAAEHISLVVLPPRPTHIMQPVHMDWRRAFKTRRGRYVRNWLVPTAIDRAHCHLPSPARIVRGFAARYSHARKAFATVDAAGEATLTYNADPAFAAARPVPFNAGKPPASPYVLR